MYEDDSDDDDALYAVQAALMQGSQHHNTRSNGAAPFKLPIDESDYYGYGDPVEDNFGTDFGTCGRDQFDALPSMAGDSSWGPAGILEVFDHLSPPWTDVMMIHLTRR